MKRKLVVEFTKMSGAGNDFIVIDNRFYHFSDSELGDIARMYCPRRTGIGADGVLALSPASDSRADFRMRYLNADGSVGTMCGNGARCMARFARLGGIEGERVQFETDAGLYSATFVAGSKSSVALAMRNPESYQPNINLISHDSLEAAYIWTGTEHVVVFVDDVDTAPVSTLGADIRHDPSLGSAGANVNFVEVSEGESGAALRVRTFEKGVEEETLACGTGAVASAVVAYLAGRIEREAVAVRMRGGMLRVRFENGSSGVSNIVLEGPADVIFRGTFEW